MAPVDLKRVAALFGAAGAYDVEAERLRAQGADPLPYVVLAARARAKLRDEFGIDTASAEAAAAEAAVRAEIHAESARDFLASQAAGGRPVCDGFVASATEGNTFCARCSWSRDAHDLTKDRGR